MSSYTDEWVTDFWRLLEEDLHWVPPAEEARKYVVPLPFSGPVRNGFAPKQAPSLMVEYSQKQIRELHGNQVNIPDPYVSAFYDWGDDPYGGGYPAWAGGYQVPRPWDAAKLMRQPFDDITFHVF